ncbi:probable membrane metalloprotease ARASP2, chloroplastic [Cynara cardunculus var. scolymus]|uniref:probable membrane metalloprotease ARASP2, chloroplastic n=1 Tax=Cynara cardunculus var. scolymus TaxID=59895 RepID=UPI000D630AE8|nr:probable membrane metalloprotease ARASP2, chloroplastic [Cynara cardunculus var. scolymus]
MLTNLSPFMPSSSYSSTIRFFNNKPKHLFSSLPPSPSPSSTPYYSSYPSSNLTFPDKRHFLHEKIGISIRNRENFKASAIAGFDFGGFQSAQSVIEAVSVLTAIIVVHESGHFLAAQLQGIRVSKFAVGFGPILAKFNANNVEYSLRAFPLGGFVGFPDNDPDSDIPVDDENLLKNRPILDRIIVISAGVIANIVFAYIIIFAQIVFVGLPVQEAFPGVIVPEVRPFSAASRDGLLAGDVILSINEIELPKTVPNSVSKVVDIIKKNPKSVVSFKVNRGGKDFLINVTPDQNMDGSGRIGVQLSPNVRILKEKPKDVLQAFSFTGREFWGLTFNVVDSLKQTFLNFSQSASKVSGPVAIIAVGAEVAKSNVDGLYQFAAILNINLAVINLLPLPALDGGSLALILVEAIRGGRKLPLEVEQGIMSSGFTLVFVLGLFLIIRDTLNLDFIKDLL